MSKIAIPIRLDALGATPKDREEVRRYYWELMTQQHTPLINQLNLKVAQHRDFADWRSNNKVDADALKALWRSFEEDSQFATMPDRAFVSARLVISNTYSSWLALQAGRQENLEKLSSSLEVLKTDAELIAISGCSLDTLRSKAKDVLSQVNAQIASSGKTKKSKKAIDGGIYKLLYKKHRTTTDAQEKCAVAYLIKNRFEIRGEETEEDIEKLRNLIHRKEKQIEILQKQLQSRLPKGRPWVGKDILDEIKSIGTVKNEIEWNLVESALLKQQTFLPHPILFESSDDLIWFRDECALPNDVKDCRSRQFQL
jgi:protein involved in ribonucleotide reduction